MFFSHEKAKREGVMSMEVMKAITAKGGEAEVRRVLEARGWSEEELVAVPTVFYDQEEKKVKGSGWRVLGPMVNSVII